MIAVTMMGWMGLRAWMMVAAICLVAAAQEPTRPFPYAEEEVSYENPAQPGVTLAGTFTKPNAGGPFPAVLLIGGSGPIDRDETTGGHKPFLVLSDYLTRRGIAVLRADRRGVGKSTGSFGQATTQEFASDGEAGVRYLMTRSDVNQKHVGLIGHGEGGIIAPMVAVKMPQISFLVLIAATAIPGEQVLIGQRERAERAAQIPDDQIDADKKIGAMLYRLVREGKNEAELRQALFHLPEDYRPFIAPWQKQLHRLEAPWLRFFLSYDPAPTLAKVKCPVLALDGDKDIEVVPDQNIRAIKAAFKTGGNRDATAEILPGLNYLLQPAKTGFGWEYHTIAETMSPVALNAIGTWIGKHTT